ncbi:UNVERIFIED_CONTAM: hypothetical protein FKN15_010491 [Acipenser sinensis]
MLEDIAIEPYCVIVEESTDISANKQLCVVFRFKNHKPSEGTDCNSPTPVMPSHMTPGKRVQPPLQSAAVTSFPFRVNAFSQRSGSKAGKQACFSRGEREIVTMGKEMRKEFTVWTGVPLWLTKNQPGCGKSPVQMVL